MRPFRHFGLLQELYLPRTA